MKLKICLNILLIIINYETYASVRNLGTNPLTLSSNVENDDDIEAQFSKDLKTQQFLAAPVLEEYDDDYYSDAESSFRHLKDRKSQDIKSTASLEEKSRIRALNIVQNEKEALTKQNTQLKQNNNRLHEEKKLLTKKIKQLSQEYNLLAQEHNELITEYNQLIKQHEYVIEQNGKLHDILEKKKSKTTCTCL